MDPTSFDMIVQEQGNGLSSIVWQPTLTVAPQIWISLFWKPRVFTIRTPICGFLVPKTSLYMDPTSMDVLCKNTKMS